jgi:hypothetical protein
MHLIKKIGSVEFKPQKINSKNIYGNKYCILQRWFKKITCSEVEVTDSEKDKRGFYNHESYWRWELYYFINAVKRQSNLGLITIK